MRARGWIAIGALVLVVWLSFTNHAFAHMMAYPFCKP